MSLPPVGIEARRQWPLWILVAVAVVWLALLLVPSAMDLASGRDALSWPLVQALAPGLLAPLALLLLLGALLPPPRRTADLDELDARIVWAAGAAEDLEAQMARIEGLLRASGERVDTLRDAAVREGDGLVASAGRVEAAAGRALGSSAEAERAMATLAAGLPALDRQSQDIDGRLRAGATEAAAQLAALAALLAEVSAGQERAAASAGQSVDAVRSLLAGIDEQSQQATKAVSARAYALDAAVTGVLDRSTATFEAIRQSLEARSAELDAMLTAARRDLEGFGVEGARAVGQRIDLLLAASQQLKQQFADQQAQADTLVERVSAGIASLHGRLATLSEVGSDRARAFDAEAERSQERIRERLAALGVEGTERVRAFDAEVERSARSLELRLNALGEAGAACARNLDAEAERSAQALQQKLDALSAASADRSRGFDAALMGLAEALEQRLAQVAETVAQRSRGFTVAMEEAVAGLDSRLAALGDAGAARSLAFEAEMERSSRSLDGLLAALGSAADASAAVEADVARLLPMLQDFGAEADARLPALAEAVGRLDTGTRALVREVEGLGSVIEGRSALVDRTVEAYALDQKSVLALTEALNAQFAAARGAVNDIRQVTEETAISAARRMVENVIQVREAVNATSLEIRTLLAAVVVEAEQALDEAASRKAETAFGAPIRLQLAAIEEASDRAAGAATAASERISGQLLGLMQTVAELEARIDEVDTKVDVRARETLVARGLRLVDALTASSIDVARLLAVEVDAKDWARFLKGERQIFARQAVRLADAGTARKIARHHAHDADFREEVSRYLDRFEQLMKRVLQDAEGEAFALVLLSSDLGKLYVLLAQALGRPALAQAA